MALAAAAVPPLASARLSRPKVPSGGEVSSARWGRRPSRPSARTRSTATAARSTYDAACRYDPILLIPSQEPHRKRRPLIQRRDVCAKAAKRSAFPIRPLRPSRRLSPCAPRNLVKAAQAHHHQPIGAPGLGSPRAPELTIIPHHGEDNGLLELIRNCGEVDALVVVVIVLAST
jgi:hypothetical protein